MPSKRPNDVLPLGHGYSQPKKMKTGTNDNNNQHTRKRKDPNSASAAVRAGSEQCTFQTLGDDEICHILSFLLCLPMPVKAPKTPPPAFAYYHRSIRVDTMGMPAERPAAALAAFRQLPDEEQRKFYSMAGVDRTMFNAQRARFKHYLKQRFFFPRELAKTTRTLKLVCIQMHRVVSKFTNHSAPEEVIAPERLASIKTRVGRLNLVPVCKSFIRLCDDVYCDRKFLPSDLYHQHGDDGDHSPLEYIARHYANSDYDSLATLISVEYRKFLICKAVELEVKKEKAAGNETSLSSSSSSSSLSCAWNKTSMPGQLVHTFWQAHMLSPRKYLEDCISVADEIIDCEASSYSDVNPKLVFEYYRKRRELFAFEHQLTKEHFHTGRQPALYMIENVVETASMLREEEAMEEHDDTYDDESDDDGEDEHADNENEPEAEANGHDDVQEAEGVVHYGSSG